MATAHDATAAAPFRLPVRDDRVNDLLLWRCPKKTGAILAVLVGTTLAIRFSTINFIGALAYSLLAVVLGAFIWNNFASFAGRPPLPVPAFVRDGVTEEQTKELAVKATPCLNRLLGWKLRVMTGREPALTGAVAGVLYLIAILSAAVTLSMLSLTFILAAFILPKAYELKQAEVDAALSKAREVATTVYDRYLSKVHAVLPRGVGAAKKEE